MDNLKPLGSYLEASNHFPSLPVTARPRALPALSGALFGPLCTRPEAPSRPVTPPSRFVTLFARKCPHRAYIRGFRHASSRSVTPRHAPSRPRHALSRPTPTLSHETTACNPPFLPPHHQIALFFTQSCACE